MVEPTTPNQGFIVPNTGDLPAAWGTAAINPNMSQMDGLFSGLLSLSLSASTTVVLGTNPASITPSAGPYQSANAAIFLSGNQTGNAVIRLSTPQIYRVINQCTPNQWYVQLAPAFGGGLTQGVPPGESHHYWYDGINVFFLDLPHVGTYWNFAGSSIPPWIGACTVLPWVLCNGATYPTSFFGALASYLGSTFGGNGVTTFGVPDMQSRVYLMQDVSGVNRVTGGGSGIAGNVIAATGGSEFLQSHVHGNTLSDPGHAHSPGSANAFMETSGSGTGVPVNSFGITLATPGVTGAATTGISINNAAAGGAFSQNMPPAIVGGLTFIKT